MDFGKLTEDQKTTARMIADEARANFVDPEFALAIAFRENRFLNRVNPDSGAIGPMQVMPHNAKPLNMTIEDLNDPRMNVIAGVRILKENLDRYKGDAKLSAIAYNSRPVVADRYAKHGDDSLCLKRLRTIGVMLTTSETLASMVTCLRKQRLNNNKTVLILVVNQSL